MIQLNNFGNMLLRHPDRIQAGLLMASCAVASFLNSRVASLFMAAATAPMSNKIVIEGVQQFRQDNIRCAKLRGAANIVAGSMLLIVQPLHAFSDKIIAAFQKTPNPDCLDKLVKKAFYDDNLCAADWDPTYSPSLAKMQNTGRCLLDGNEEQVLATCNAKGTNGTKDYTFRTIRDTYSQLGKC